MLYTLLPLINLPGIHRCRQIDQKKLRAKEKTRALVRVTWINVTMFHLDLNRLLFAELRKKINIHTKLSHERAPAR